MDQRMPTMDGAETLHRIQAQQNGANREKPVICLTADAIIGAKERYLAQGFTDYLTKPIDSRAPEQMLMKYLPEEKVIAVTEDAWEAETGERAPEGYAPLRAAGIDPAVGLHYCQGDDSEVLEFYPE